MLMHYGGKVKQCNPSEKKQLGGPQKIKSTVTTWSSNPISEYFRTSESRVPKRIIGTLVFPDTFITVTKIWTWLECPLADEWIKNVAYPHDGILLNVLKEENSGTCFIYDPWGHDGEISQSHDNYSIIVLFWGPWSHQILTGRERLVVPKAKRRKGGKLLSKRCSFTQGRKRYGSKWGDCCIPPWMCLTLMLDGNSCAVCLSLQLKIKLKSHLQWLGGRAFA